MKSFPDIIRLDDRTIIKFKLRNVDLYGTFKTDMQFEQLTFADC